MGVYRFPANKRAEEATLPEQIKKLMEEVAEVSDAYLHKDGTILEETWDVIYAAEGILRKFPTDEVERAKEYVRTKAVSRGDVN